MTTDREYWLQQRTCPDCKREWPTIIEARQCQHDQHDEDRLWRDAYSIAWVGACNPAGVGRTLDRYVAVYGNDHPAVRAIAGHLAFLRHESLGPEFPDLDAVVENGRRLGIHHG